MMNIKGLSVFEDIHLAPFKNFPYVSLKVDSVRVMETKAENSPVILDLRTSMLDLTS